MTERTHGDTLFAAERGAAQRVAAGEAIEALRVSRLRHLEGHVELLGVLTIRRRVFSAGSSLLSVERARLERWVNLNLALGDSWE